MPASTGTGVGGGGAGGVGGGAGGIVGGSGGVVGPESWLGPGEASAAGVIASVSSRASDSLQAAGSVPKTSNASVIVCRNLMAAEVSNLGARRLLAGYASTMARRSIAVAPLLGVESSDRLHRLEDGARIHVSACR